MTDLSWLNWAAPVAFSILAASASFAAAWGVAQARIRGLQHQITEGNRMREMLQSEFDQHVRNGVELQKMVARMDARGEHMAQDIREIKDALKR